MILKYYCSLARKVILLFTFCLNEKQNKNWNVVRVNITVVVFLCSVCNEVLSYLIHFNVISMFFFIFLPPAIVTTIAAVPVVFMLKTKQHTHIFLKFLTKTILTFVFHFMFNCTFFFFPFNSFWKLLALKSLLPSILTRLVVCFVFYV